MHALILLTLPPGHCLFQETGAARACFSRLFKTVAGLNGLASMHAVTSVPWIRGLAAGMGIGNLPGGDALGPGASPPLEVLGPVVRELDARLGLEAGDLILAVDGRALAIAAGDIERAVAMCREGRRPVFSMSAPGDHPCQLVTYERLYDAGALCLLDAGASAGKAGLPGSWLGTRPFPSPCQGGEDFFLPGRASVWGGRGPVRPCVPGEAEGGVFQALGPGEVRFWFDPALLPVAVEGLLGVRPPHPAQGPWLVRRGREAALLMGPDRVITDPILRVAPVLPTGEFGPESVGDCFGQRNAIPAILSDPEAGMVVYSLFATVMDTAFHNRSHFPYTGGLWDFEGGGGVIRNSVSGKVISGRQMYPEVLEAVSALAVFRFGDAPALEEMVDRGRASALILEPERAVVVEHRLDLLRAEAALPASGGE